ncbi:MAG: response regulator [Bacteriovoracaceae bacterium]|nr:response regulator [Bacteriovoracaceae bacterium]
MSKTKIIYCLDSDTEYLKLIVKFIESSPYEVKCFEKKEPFFEALNSNYPDCILLGLDKGDDSMTHFLKKRLNDKVLRSIPIIAISEEKGRSVVSEVMTYEVFDYLVKPINSYLLIMALRKLFHETKDKVVKFPDETNSVVLFPAEIQLNKDKTFTLYSSVKITKTESFNLQVPALTASVEQEKSFLCERPSTFSKTENNFVTSFTIRDKKGASTAAAQPTPKKPQSKPRVIHLDDDVDFHILIKKIVEDKLNYIYESFDNCKEMLLASKQTPPSAYIVDLNLHEGAGVGYTVVKALRNTIAGNTPILILSGSNNPSEITYGLEIGADDYLTKPVDVKLFMTKMMQLIEHTSPTGETQKTQNKDNTGTIEIPLKAQTMDEGYIYFQSPYFILKETRFSIKSRLVQDIFSVEEMVFVTHDCNLDIATSTYTIKAIAKDSNEQYFAQMRKEFILHCNCHWIWCICGIFPWQRTNGFGKWIIF